MAQISPWFELVKWSSNIVVTRIEWCLLQKHIYSCMDIRSTAVVQAVMDAYNVGPVRGEWIRDMTALGISKILKSEAPSQWIREAALRSLEYLVASVPGCPVVTKDGGNVYSDGSKIDEGKERAAFEVTEHGGKLIYSARIRGRQTSQRGEDMGLLVAKLLQPEATICADPMRSIITVQRGIEGRIEPHMWLKINNRSILRNIVGIAGLGAGLFKWVKGHQQGDCGEEGLNNHIVDKQAKLAAVSDSVAQLDECWGYTNSYFMLWKGELYEGDVRKKTLMALLKLDFNEFASPVNRARFIHNRWWMETPECKARRDFAYFRFKLFTSSLPTYNKLAKQFADIYGKRKCPLCDMARETDVHVFVECIAGNTIKDKLWEDIMEVVVKITEKDRCIVDSKVRDWVRKVKNREDQAAGWWFLRDVPVDVKIWLSRYLCAEVLGRLWNEVHVLEMEAAKEIWTQRCKVNVSRRRVLKDALEDNYVEDMLQANITQ